MIKPIVRVGALAMLVVLTLLFTVPVHASTGTRCAFPSAYSNLPAAYADYTSCSYTAAGPGAYIASGSPWCIKVTRGTSTIQQVCAQPYDYAIHTGQLLTQAGDVVTVTIQVTTGCAVATSLAVCAAEVQAGDQP